MISCVTSYAGELDSGSEGNHLKTFGNVEFIPNNQVNKPVDPDNPNPTNPVMPINPLNPKEEVVGTTGPLSLDYASSFDFGSNRITNADQTYYANSQGFSGNLAGSYRGNYVQVSDNRGTNGGWTLTVKQMGQFRSNDAKKFKELKGAGITLEKAQVDSNTKEAGEPLVSEKINLDVSGATSHVMSAREGEGMGTWVAQFGTSRELLIDGKKISKNQEVSLFVPGATPKEAVRYQTALVWVLTDMPRVN